MSLAAQWVPNIRGRVLYGFQEAVVDRLEGSRVTSLKFEYGTLGGHDLKCFPVTEKGLEIAKLFTEAKDAIYTEAGILNVNWPSISNHLEEMFDDAMENVNDDGYVESVKNQLDSFYKNMISTIQEIKRIKVEGIFLLRR